MFAVNVWIVLGYMCFHASNINLSCAAANTLCPNLRDYLKTKFQFSIKIFILE